MARRPLQVEMKFHNLHCHKEGDGLGGSEAYLWTVYFKFDGDSVVFGDDYFLHGNCTIFPTPGSHGNLGDNHIGEGEDVPVPAAIGEFRTTLNPIPVTPGAREDLGIEDVGGVVGVVCVLMEENWVSDAGAEAGHVAVNNFVRQVIDTLIPTLGAGNQDVTDEEITALTAGAADKVADAIIDAQGPVANFFSFFDRDVLLGIKVFTFTHDTFVGTSADPGDAFQDMQHRFQYFVTLVTNSPFLPPQRILVADFELFGEVQGIQVCPVAATSSLLKSQGFMSDEDARDFTDAAHEFRRRVFAGDGGLGAWWLLAQRNTASMAGVMRSHSKVVERAAPAVFAELALALYGKGHVSEAFVKYASELMTLFIAHGPRQLRVDSKAALRVLPSLAGKSLEEALDILRSQQPTRLTARRLNPPLTSLDQ